MDPAGPRRSGISGEWMDRADSRLSVRISACLPVHIMAGRAVISQGSNGAVESESIISRVKIHLQQSPAAWEASKKNKTVSVLEKRGCYLALCAIPPTLKSLAETVPVLRAPPWIKQSRPIITCISHKGHTRASSLHPFISCRYRFSSAQPHL
jgi:hypothetical protein